MPFIDATTATIKIGDIEYPVTDFKIDLTQETVDISSFVGGGIRSTFPVSTSVKLTGTLKQDTPKREHNIFAYDDEDMVPYDEDDEEEIEDECEGNDECMCDDCLQIEREEEEYECCTSDCVCDDCLRPTYNGDWPEVESTRPLLLPSELPVMRYTNYFSYMDEQIKGENTPMPLLTQPTNTESFRTDKAKLMIDALVERIKARYPNYSVTMDAPKEQTVYTSYGQNPSKGTHLINHGTITITKENMVVAFFPNGTLGEMIWMNDSELQKHVAAQIEKQEGEYRQKLTKELITKFSQRLAKMGYHRWVIEHDFVVPSPAVSVNRSFYPTSRTDLATFIAVSTDGMGFSDASYVRVGPMEELIAVSDEEFKKRVATAISYRKQVTVGGTICLSPNVSEKTISLIKYVEKSR